MIGLAPKLLTCPSTEDHVIEDENGQLVPHPTKGDYVKH